MRAVVYVGDYVYIGPDGAITRVAPTAAGQIVNCIGVVVGKQASTVSVAIPGGKIMVYRTAPDGALELYDKDPNQEKQT